MLDRVTLNQGFGFHYKHVGQPLQGFKQGRTWFYLNVTLIIGWCLGIKHGSVKMETGRPEKADLR